MSLAALKRRGREARAWMMDACFPLWSKEGVGSNGLFREVLDLSHRPGDRETTRVRVQARQVYLFAEALRLGWDSERAETLIEMGLKTLSGPALRDDGVAGKTLSHETCALVDDTADLYDTAFTLFAFANGAMAFPSRAEAGAASLLTALDLRMRDTARGGYAEKLPPPEVRLQNPHMHLLEACHALHVAGCSGDHLARANEIVTLFSTRFTDHPDGTLGEKFASDWSPSTGDAHDVIEPGHQFEWVWLLHRHAALTGTEVEPGAEKLYDFAMTTVDDQMRAVQSVRRDGTPVDSSRRTWPQTEALKAHLAMLEATGEEIYAERAVATFDVLMDEYLTPEGGWIDHYDADGQVIAADMPASTGYHVVLALAETLRVTGT